MFNFKEKFNEVKSKMLPATIGVGTAILTAVPVFAEDPATTSNLGTIVNASMLQGVFDQIYALVPIVIPVVITFIAFRKGWSLLKGQLLGA